MGATPGLKKAYMYAELKAGRVKCHICPPNKGCNGHRKAKSDKHKNKRG